MSLNFELLMSFKLLHLKVIMSPKTPSGSVLKQILRQDQGVPMNLSKKIQLARGARHTHHHRETIP